MEYRSVEDEPRLLPLLVAGYLQLFAGVGMAILTLICGASLAREVRAVGLGVLVVSGILVAIGLALRRRPGWSLFAYGLLTIPTLGLLGSVIAIYGSLTRG